MVQKQQMIVHLKQKGKKIKLITYLPNEQHAHNVGIIIQCDESNNSHLFFSKRKFIYEIP